MKNKGFTLLEMIMAVFVIMVGIVGVYGVFSRLISQSSLNSSRLVAVYLAQEGVELVRNIRDGNWLEPGGTAWDAGLADGEYIIDYDDAYLKSFEDEVLNLDTNNFYSYDLITKPTKFKRKITITKMTVDELKVFVKVEWPEGSVIIQEHLYDWK